MSETPLDLIRAETADDETIHAVMLASETDDEQYYIVLRSGEHSGNLMLKERYFVARSDGTGTYMSNGINRRVPETGDGGKSFARGLARLYARLSNDHNPQSTKSKGNAALLIGAEASDDEAKARMTTPAGESVETDDDQTTLDETDDGTDPDPKTTATGERPDQVKCEKCGRKGPREDMVNFGGGLIDAWVHEAGCPE